MSGKSTRTRGRPKGSKNKVSPPMHENETKQDDPKKAQDHPRRSSRIAKMAEKANKGNKTESENEGSVTSSESDDNRGNN